MILLIAKIRKNFIYSVGFQSNYIGMLAKGPEFLSNYKIIKVGVAGIV